MNYVALGKGRTYKPSGEESRSTLPVVPDENNTNLIIKCRIGYVGYFPFVQGEKFLA
jgi:hypothetical protein